MRLAIIDHSGYVDKALKNIPGLEVACAKNFEEFEKEHGSISSFDGVMLHPGRGHQRQALEYMKQHPQIKYCILSLNPESYHHDGKTTIIPAYEISRIVQYFGIFEQT